MSTPSLATECYDPKWKPVANDACRDELYQMGSSACAVPPVCVFDAYGSPYAAPAPPDSVGPQYGCQLMHSGGWKFNDVSPSGSPISFCGREAALGSNLSPGNWNECVKYGNMWHITSPGTSPGVDNKSQCYGSGNGDTPGESRTLCLTKDDCPLYVQTEADKKCVRYPTKQACMNTLKINNPNWNINPESQPAITASIRVTDSGHKNVTASTSYMTFNVILILLFIVFFALGYFLLLNVEKYKKGKTSSTLVI